MKLKRPLHGPDDPRGPVRGRDVVAVKRGLWKVETDFFPKPPGGFDDVYNAKVVEAVTIFQRVSDIAATGRFGQSTLDALWPYMDAYARLLYATYRPPKPKPKPAVPDLGPVRPGGTSVLDQDLTHPTSGIPLYPAFDDAFGVGREVIAPEDIVVVPNPRTGALWSSSNPGKAFYADGVLGYWFGHLDRNHPVGTRFKKGQLIGKTAPNDIGGGPHVHTGVNVERLLGKGRELLHHTDYTHGAPTIRQQLEKELA